MRVSCGHLDAGLEGHLGPARHEPALVLDLLAADVSPTSLAKGAGLTTGRNTQKLCKGSDGFGQD